MKVYFHTPERPESSCWRDLGSLPVKGETVRVDGIPYIVMMRDWDLGSAGAAQPNAEVVIYLEQKN